MIVFLGDSFTWGQGLYFEEWYKNGVSIGEINKYTPNAFPHENLSYNDHLIRKSNHFPNLVAKHFNKHYDNPKITNGGTNWDIANNIRNLEHSKDSVELIVIQFTDFIRSAPSVSVINNVYKNELNGIDVIDLDYRDNRDLNYFNQIMEIQFKIIQKELDKVGKPWLALSWHDDIGKLLKLHHRENFIPIKYKGVEYDSFDWFLDSSQFKSLSINGTLGGCFDNHLSIEGHAVVADSIIEKIEDMKIFN